MTSYSVTESPVEDATLTGLEGLGWQVATAPTSRRMHPTPSVTAAARGVLERRLRDSHIWVSNARNIYDEPER